MQIPHVQISHRSCVSGVIISLTFFEGSYEMIVPLDYPEKPPRLVSKSISEFASVSDGRDLLKAIVPNWNSQVSFAQIAGLLEEFKNSQRENEDIGEFHLLDLVPLDLWQDRPGMEWFFCIETDPLNGKTCRNRIIAITHSYFLLLEPHPTDHRFAYIIFWASLSALSNIQKSKTQENSFILQWDEKIKPNIQLFKSVRGNVLIHLISENLSKLGSIVQNTFLLKIEEKLEKIKIYDILRKIERNERLLETYVEDEKINALIALYQKAVEYFSGINDSRFEIYLAKLQNLFTDKRVMEIICSDIQLKARPNRSRGRSMELQLPQDHFINSKRKSMEFFSGYTFNEVIKD